MQWMPCSQKIAVVAWAIGLNGRDRAQAEGPRAHWAERQGTEVSGSMYLDDVVPALQAFTQGMEMAINASDAAESWLGQHAP